MARNTRSHGKPSWCNESDRENRHGNNDGVHRRKQGWLWCAAGCFWTWHSWDGCEGIDDTDYKAPGAEFLKPMASFFKALPFSEMDPNYTAVTVNQTDLVWTSLARPDRLITVTYICGRATGQKVAGASAQLRLPNGPYRIVFQNLANLAVVETRDYVSGGLHRVARIPLPDFTDDLVITVRMEQANRRTQIPGNQ